MFERRGLLLGLAIALCIYGGWNAWTHRGIDRPPGILAPDEPLQQNYDPLPAAFGHDDYVVQPLARFSLLARVLSRSDYHLDRLSSLIPTDLALGWGPMSDSTVLHSLKIEQNDRFYFWSATEFPIPRRDIETHSANMHLIPADAGVRRTLRRIRPGALIQLSGELVEVHAAKGWSIRSSMTRDDAGAGACEVVWVETLEQR
jgi:hypothetical protein